MSKTAIRKTKAENVYLAAVIADLCEVNKETSRIIRAHSGAGKSMDIEFHNAISEALEELLVTIKALRIRLLQRP